MLTSLTQILYEISNFIFAIAFIIGFIAYIIITIVFVWEALEGNNDFRKSMIIGLFSGIFFYSSFSVFFFKAFWIPILYGTNRNLENAPMLFVYLLLFIIIPVILSIIHSVVLPFNRIKKWETFTAVFVVFPLFTFIFIQIISREETFFSYNQLLRGLGTAFYSAKTDVEGLFLMIIACFPLILFSCIPILMYYCLLTLNPFIQKYKMISQEKKAEKEILYREKLRDQIFYQIGRLIEGYFEEGDLMRLCEDIASHSDYSLPSEILELVSTIERLRKEFLGNISEPDLEGIFYTMEEIREILESDDKSNEKIELSHPKYIFLKEKAEELEDFLYSKKTIDLLLDLDG